MGRIIPGVVHQVLRCNSSIPALESAEVVDLSMTLDVRWRDMGIISETTMGLGTSVYS